jgi:hypothetical protein
LIRDAFVGSDSITTGGNYYVATLVSDGSGHWYVTDHN